MEYVIWIKDRTVVLLSPGQNIHFYELIILFLQSRTFYKTFKVKEQKHQLVLLKLQYLNIFPEVET